MTKAQEQETKRHGDYLTQLLDIAIQVAEQDRTERLKGTIPNGESYGAIAPGNLIVRIFERYSNCYLIVAYDSSNPSGDVIYLPKLLDTAYAWILKYDSYHAKWNVKAWNAETGNRLFSRLAHRLAKE